VAESNKPKQLVLVVEDETLIRMNSVDMIRNLGFEVIEAIDADEAVYLLGSIPGIEVVFTDIQMPGSMDGLLLAAVVKDRWPPVALLITSGKDRPSVAEMPTGAQFIPKPYSCFELGEQLHRLTGRG
jgi:two-component system, response regulator PdtaR